MRGLKLLCRLASVAVLLYHSQGVGLHAEDTSESAVAAGSFESWRRADRDAANAIYFVMKCHNVEVTYDQVVRSIGDGRVSLRQIQESAADLGLQLTTLKASPQMLAELTEPVIGFYEQGGAGSPSFIVLLSTDALDSFRGGAMIFDAGSAQIRGLPADEFRRNFSGYILKTPEESRPAGHTWILLGGVAGFVVITTWRFILERRSKVTTEEPINEQFQQLETQHVSA